jgi:hypothetical protein
MSLCPLFPLCHCVFVSLCLHTINTIVSIVSLCLCVCILLIPLCPCVDRGKMISPSCLNSISRPPQLPPQPTPQPPILRVPCRHPRHNGRVLLGGEGARLQGLSSEAALATVPFVLTHRCDPLQLLPYAHPVHPNPDACVCLLLHQLMQPL